MIDTSSIAGTVRSYEAAVTDAKKSERSIVARISTSDVDRFNSSFSPGGAKLENYRRNPVVGFEHGKDPRRGRDPIGTNVWIKSDGGPNPTSLIAKTRFLNDDFAQQRWEWYRDGVLRGFSVTALPDWERCGPATREEITANPALGRGYYTERGGGPGVLMYRSWELASYDTCSIPGNANCLTMDRAAELLGLVERGLWLPEDDLAAIRGLLVGRESVEGVNATPGASRGPWVDADGSYWYVRAGNGTVIARYDDARAAERCLRALTDAPGPTYASRVQADVLAVRAWGDERIERAVEELTLKLTGHCGSAK